MIVLDTSALIDSLCGTQNQARLRGFLVAGEIVALPAIVLFEWFRGPRLREELLAQEVLFPRDEEMDLAIAATAIARDAALWTLNESDFADIPGVELARI